MSDGAEGGRIQDREAVGGDAPAEGAPGAEGSPEEGAAEERGDEEDAEGPSVDAPPNRRRFAPILLVLGLIGALLVGRQAMPTSRTVVLRLEGDRAEVRSVRLGIGRLADADEDVSSVEWRYEAGSPPPPVLRKELSLAPGQHRFRVEVERRGAPQAQTTRVVDVADEEVTIRVPTY